MSKPDDFNELEQMLADLPMRQPSQMLDQRIAATLGDAVEETSRGHRIRRYASVWSWAAAVVIAASVVAVVLLLLNQAPSDTGPIAEGNSEGGFALTPDTTPETANQPTIQPINLVWSRDANEQLRYTPAGKPYRAVVRQTIDQRVWVDPDTGATMQTTTPREELYIVEQPVY